MNGSYWRIFILKNLVKKFKKWIFEKLSANSRTENLSMTDNNNSVLSHALILVDVTIKYSGHLWLYFKLNIKYAVYLLFFTYFYFHSCEKKYIIVNIYQVKHAMHH